MEENLNNSPEPAGVVQGEAEDSSIDPKKVGDSVVDFMREHNDSLPEDNANRVTEKTISEWQEVADLTASELAKDPSYASIETVLDITEEIFPGDRLAKAIATTIWGMIEYRKKSAKENDERRILQEGAKRSETTLDLMDVPREYDYPDGPKILTPREHNEFQKGLGRY